MKRRVLDVSALPPIAFSHRDPLWWGIVCLIIIEGTMLALLAIAHFYVRQRTSPWPPTLLDGDAVLAGTVEVGLWLASIPFAVIAQRGAIAGNLRQMRVGLIGGTALGVAALVCRGLVFWHLPYRWDAHAHGSVDWTMLGVQLSHALTSVLEDAFYVMLVFRGPIEEKHRVDIEVTVILMYFVIAGAVLTWAVTLLEPFLAGGGL